MNWGLLLLTFLAGSGLVVQVGLNAAIGQALGRPIFGAVVNFMVGLVALLVFVAATRVPLPSRDALTAAPAWAWLGGLMGALYVATVTIGTPARRGADAGAHGRRADDRVRDLRSLRIAGFRAAAGDDDARDRRAAAMRRDRPGGDSLNGIC